jgi:hypothetical protein
MSNPSVLGNEAQLKFNLASSGAFTEILNIKEMSTPEPETASVNVSGLLDADDIKTPGFNDNKTFSFTMFHTPVNFGLLSGVLYNPSVMANWELTLSDSSEWAFQGFITGYKSKIDRNNAVLYECTVEINGSMTYSA